WHGGHLPLAHVPPRRDGPRLHRGLIGDAVEPVADHLSRNDRRGLADEDEKGRLECVLGVLWSVKDSATNPPDHRPVPAHERGERRLLAAGPGSLPPINVRRIPPRRVGAGRAGGAVEAGYCAGG